jgi:hypothetical protein
MPPEEAGFELSVPVSETVISVFTKGKGVTEAASGNLEMMTPKSGTEGSNLSPSSGRLPEPEQKLSRRDRL